MSITRRQALKTASAAVLASSIAKPAIAQKSPIQIGYLPALTGPSSSTGVGINRGTQLAVEEINKAGGIDRPAIAQKSPIQIGYLPALTGPSSSTGVGINRGTQLAVEEINKAGGID